MDRFIKWAIATFVVATAIIVIAPIVHEKASLHAQTVAAACSNPQPMFALANVSPIQSPPSPVPTPYVSFYNMDACGYKLSGYTDASSKSHCQLIDPNGMIVTDFYFDPPMTDTEGTASPKPIASPPACSH
jgi:hypothetical protein